LLVVIGAMVVVIAGAAAGFFFVRGSEEGNMDAASAAIAKADWSVAAALLDEALATKPDFLRQHDTEALALRGLSFYQLADYETALVDMNAALARDPNLVDLLVYRADIQYRKGNDEAALADFEEALAYSDLLPEHLLALVYADRAAIYHDQSKAAEAKEEVAQALELGRYVSDQTVAELYAIRAQSTFELEGVEADLTDNLTALDMDVGLTSETRASLLADQTAIYHHAGLYDLVLERSDEAIALEDLAEDDLANMWVQRADALFRQGDLNGAIAEAEEAVSHGQGEALLHALQAIAGYEEGDEEQALTEAEAALAIDQDMAPAYRVRGTLYAWQGKLDQTLADLGRALELDPADVEALAMRVFADLELNDLEAAEADLARAQAINPAAPATLWAEAQLAYYNYDFETARALLDLAIEQDPSRPEFYVWRSWTYRTTVEEDLVKRDLEQALTNNDDFALALEGMLGVKANFNEMEGYEEETRRLIELYPDNYRLYTRLGYYELYDMDDSEAALATAEKILTLRPESTVGYLLRGYIHLEDEEYELARADFDQALSVRPNSLDALGAIHWVDKGQEEYDQALNQAWIYNLQDDRQSAWGKIHKALAYDPDFKDALLTRAEMYIDNGEFDQAQLDLHRVLDRYPRDGWAHTIQARAYYAQGRYDEMVEAAEKALEIDPTMTDSYWYLWLGALAEEDFERALEHTQEWAEAAPASARAHFFLGGAHNALGSSRDAVDALSEAITLSESDDPGLGDYYYERHLAYLDLGEPETAKADLEAALVSTTNLDTIDRIEIALANPGVLARSVAGRRVIEDEAGGFTISYDEKWQQWPAEPSEGYMLSLAYGEDELNASADVYIYYDWDPSLSLYDLAAYINPAENGAVVKPLEQVQINGISGLMRPFEFEGPGRVEIGRQYMVAKGNKLVIISVWAIEEIYPEFEAEFDALVDSFAFLD
jgi:tetratricopeptide (TPR) repeat protein